MTIHELRLEAGLSVAQLASLARVDRKTIDRAEEGRAMQEVKAYAIVRALSQRLGRKIRLDDVDGLNIL